MVMFLNGRRCYGVCGVDPNRGYIRESTLEELVKAHVHIVRPRSSEYNPPDLNGRTIDEYNLDECIPDEGKNMYKENDSIKDFIYKETYFILNKL